MPGSWAIRHPSRHTWYSGIFKKLYLKWESASHVAIRENVYKPKYFFFFLRCSVHWLLQILMFMQKNTFCVYDETSMLAKKKLRVWRYKGSSINRTPALFTTSTIEGDQLLPSHIRLQWLEKFHIIVTRNPASHYNKTAHAAFSTGFRLMSMSLSCSGSCANGGRSGELNSGFPGRLRRLKLNRGSLFPNRLSSSPGRLRWAASSCKLKMAGTLSPRPVPAGPVSNRMLKM